MQLACRSFYLLVTAPQIPRGPIELAQAIQDGALDTVLGVAGEGHLLVGIEFAGCIEKTENTSMNQIV